MEKLPFLGDQQTQGDEDDSGLLESTKHTLRRSEQQVSRRKEQCWMLLLTVTLSCISAALGSLATNQWWHAHIGSTCLKKTTRSSPLTADIDIKYQSVQFNGSLLKENVYRQKGSPEVDEAWAELGVDYHSVIVPADQAQRVGLAPDQVKIRPENGGGYPANVEGLHQLHCLNLVRQSLFYNYEYYHAKGEGAFRNNDYILQKHVSHCLDIVRQQLMCTVDIGVMGQVWFQPSMAEYPEAYVDFNTEHVCRNFDDVRAWAKAHQIPADMPEDFLEPPKDGDRIYHTIP